MTQPVAICSGFFFFRQQAIFDDFGYIGVFIRPPVSFVIRFPRFHRLKKMLSLIRQTSVKKRRANRIFYRLFGYLPQFDWKREIIFFFISGSKEVSFRKSGVDVSTAECFRDFFRALNGENLSGNKNLGRKKNNRLINTERRRSKRQCRRIEYKRLINPE